MVRYVGWLINSALFVLCCFLVADTANAIIAAWLAEPPRLAPVQRTTTNTGVSSWEQRQIIVQRNLFHSASLTAAEPEPELVPDVLEETNLPLRLWGTIASPNPELSWASLEELDSRGEGSKVLRVGDSIKTAEVIAIERRRIVLLENGIRRSLTLDDEVTTQPVGITTSQLAGNRGIRSARANRTRRSSPSPTARTRRSARESIAERVKNITENKFEVERESVEETLNNPSSLYTQARMLPKMGDDGSFSGIEISGIKPGSVFEQVGIEEGDIITAIGGEPINNVGESQGLLSELSAGQSIDLTVQSPDGEVLTKQFQFPPQ